MKKLISLFTTFFILGSLSFGGGLGMIAMLEQSAIKKHGWLTESEFSDLVAISETTPGVIAVNAATFIGMKIAGVIGAVVATLGTILPAFMILLVFSIFYDMFISVTLINEILISVRVAVTLLIIRAGVSLLNKIEKTIFNYFIFFIVLVLSLFVPNLSSIVVILITSFFVLWIDVVLRKARKHA